VHGIDGFLHRLHDVGNADLVRRPRQLVAAARATHRLDQPGTAQLDEQLLQVGQADVLPLRDRGQRDQVVAADFASASARSASATIA
jgi:hypothetical protein